MTIIVERDQVVGCVNPEDQTGADHEQPDPQYPPEHRHEEPVAEVGDQFALAPPWRSGVAGPVVGQHREQQRQRDRDRHHLADRLAQHLDEFHEKTGR
jgi:hypothetical protein